jgi:two-component system, cell cycle sensor histidine kinase and response regulator CckA
MTNDLIDALLGAASHEHAAEALSDALVVLSQAGFEVRKTVDAPNANRAEASRAWLDIDVGGSKSTVIPPPTLSDADASRVRQLLSLCVRRAREREEMARVEHALKTAERASGASVTGAERIARECRLAEWAAVAFNATVVSDGVTILSAGGRTVELVGYEVSELVGRPILDFVAPHSKRFVEHVVVSQHVGAYDVVLLSKSGDLVPVEIVSALSTWNGQSVRFAGLRDLRGLRRLEAERWRLEQNVERGRRLQSWGTLAAGISHDFGNLLVGITANAEVLLQLCTQPEAAEYAKEIHTAGRRAADLVAELLTFNGHRESVHKELVDVGDLVLELRKLLSAKLASNAAIVMRIEPGCTVIGNRARLSQVLMNLLTNASDALEGNPGQIIVTIDTIEHLDPRWDDAWGARLFPGSHVLIEVRDTGVGMDAGVIERAFEPFFTTKDTGNGLGLAACLDAIRAHDGAVHVESEPGKGTCFSVVIPARTEAVGVDGRRNSARVPRSKHVLVLDDEALFRTQVRHSLELRGYRVTEAADILQAQGVLDDVQPDLLLVDMVLGDSDGVKFLTDLRKQGFSMPAVMISGYVDSHLMEVLPHDTFQAFLRKPCSVSDLVSTLEQVTTAPLHEVTSTRAVRTW